MQKIKTIGLITYHFPHLKTEQIIENLLPKYKELKIYALPFKYRKEREVFFNHRPNQTVAVAPEAIAKKHNLEYIICNSDLDIDNSCDIYLVLGAGILSKECVENKRIINSHPGIIPASRGLDSFKWAIYENKPLGVSLHYIDKEVDAGEIISIIPTTIYETDSLETLSRRHYENEVKMLSNFDYYLQNPINNFLNIKIDEPKMRMKIEIEVKLARMFDEYIEQFSL